MRAKEWAELGAPAATINDVRHTCNRSHYEVAHAATINDVRHNGSHDVMAPAATAMHEEICAPKEVTLKVDVLVHLRLCIARQRYEV